MCIFVLHPVLQIMLQKTLIVLTYSFKTIKN